MTRAVEYFQDDAMKQKIPQDENGDIFLDFIETPVGEPVQSSVFVHNIVEDPIQFQQPYTTDARLKITEFPPTLMRNGLGKITLQFSDPHKTLRALNAKWGFRRVIIG